MERFLCQRVKEIWLAPAAAGARERAAALCGKYATRYPKAIETLENSLEDSLTFYAFPQPDHRKIALTSMLERLNKEIRRWISVIGIFPDSDSCVRLMTTTDGTTKVQCYLRFLCASGDRLSYRVFRGLVGLSCLHLKAFSGGYNSCCSVNPSIGFHKLRTLLDSICFLTAIRDSARYSLNPQRRRSSERPFAPMSRKS